MQHVLNLSRVNNVTAPTLMQAYKPHVSAIVMDWAKMMLGGKQWRIEKVSDFTK